LAKCYAIIGSNYNGKKDYDKAIEYYQKAIAIKPDLHEAFNDIGVAYVKKKEYDKAIEHFQKAIDIKPDDYETFHNMGNTYVHKKDYDKAIKHYQQAIAIKPDYHRAYNSWGLTLLKMNKIEEGKEKLEKSIALGNLSHGNANLGHIFLIEQKETAALQHYRKSLAAFEDKNKFWELMKEDFEGLNLEQYGISAAYYEEVLGKIKL